MHMDAFLPQLEKGNCPSPSQSTLALMELLQKDNAGLDEAAKLIRLDPILTAKIIKLVNSPLYRSTRPIVSLDDALMRIGLRIVVHMALGLNLINGKLPSAPEFNLTHFWSANLLRAISMQALATEIGNWPAGEVFIFGLLSEIGGLMIVCNAPEKSAALTNQGLGLAQQQAFEKNQLGFNRHELTAALMRQWHFPEIMIKAIEAQPQQPAPPLETGSHNPNDRLQLLVRILEAGRTITEWATSSTSDRSLEALQKKIQSWWVNTPHFASMIHQTLSEWAAVAEILDLPKSPPGQEKLESVRNALLSVRDQHQNESSVNKPLLLIDGQDTDRAILQRTLEPAGYQILQASSVDEAFTIIYKNTPRIILLDWAMPEIGGLLLCRRLRREFGLRLYIIILTAHYNQDDALEALEAGANDYLGKPIDRNFLLAKLLVAKKIVEFISSLESNCEQLIHQNHSLQSMAMKDALTGLANRRGADEFLKQHWPNALRHQSDLSCIMIDIDHFKKINDQYGHDQGDRVLAAVGKTILEISRIGDLTARVGGEEFMIICLQCNQENAASLAERLRQSVTKIVGTLPPVTISVGVSELNAAMANIEALLRAADQALLTAKRQGRNRVVCAPKIP
ncbi:diguanylate cyclase [Acidithiobacillus montserratensis]|uniref:Diguanylate cyclase n=1 Tax=Acidithiobacillus montserratensis TaxID=2729135 RepID=A0ACD5HJ65_9PROT|nr:diguanylate cyclase [Acidithiobacillus montserratensis]MBN2679194.1 diguanylate cyclase [Acidithiobacillaceae bacterium]MBU2747755.1 diguanylate cyclase [Acidithiobacillus montserratensis]